MTDNPDKLKFLESNIINNQATVNIGTIGHVAHGKSTVVRSISNKQPARFKEELKENKTIKLGYANAKIFQCNNCPEQRSYQGHDSSKPNDTNCKHCGTKMRLIRHISFVDCPGHDAYMATMLNGAAVMDGALLLIAGNEECPQPQTSEHLAAIQIMKLKHIIILQNKIDLVNEVAAKQQYEEIKNFTRGTIAEKSPIIPISAQLGYNLDVVCEFLVKKIPIPERDLTLPLHMVVIRSFDANLPGTDLNSIKGGIAGGSIMHGVIKVNQKIQIRPGHIEKHHGKWLCKPINSKIVSLEAEKKQLDFAVPGGLIGVGMQIDPSLTRGDKIVGHLLGLAESLPNIFTGLNVKFFMLPRLLGVKTVQGKNQILVEKLTIHENIKVNIGSMTTGATVLKVNSDIVKLELNIPVCTKNGEKVALSRKIKTSVRKWRLVGMGTIESGETNNLRVLN